MISQISGEIELKNCTFVKTVLMILVVFYHAVVFWTGGWFLENLSVIVTPLAVLATWLNSFHVYAFALVSGYIFYYVKFEKDGYQKYGNFFLTKVRRLIVPYVFIATVWVVPLSNYFFHDSALEILNDYVLCESPGQLWFLLMLFCVFMLFWPLSKFFKDKNLLGVLVVLFIYILGIAGHFFIPDVFKILTACAYFPLFYFGFKIRQFGSRLLYRIPLVVYFILDLLLFATVKKLKNYDGLIYDIFDIGTTFFLHIVGALMAFVTLQKLAGFIPWENNKGFKSFAKISMPVYLIHQQIIYFVIYFLHGLVNPYVNALLNFIIAMSVSVGISFLLMKTKYTRFLIGEK